MDKKEIERWQEHPKIKQLIGILEKDGEEAVRNFMLTQLDKLRHCPQEPLQILVKRLFLGQGIKWPYSTFVE